MPDFAQFHRQLIPKRSRLVLALLLLALAGMANTKSMCEPWPEAVSCDEDSDCDDGNPCTGNSCSDGWCSPSDTELNGTPCDDGDVCTIGDSCQEGACYGGAALACDDGNACTTDSCDSESGCTNVTIDCDDGNACTADSCDAESGCANVWIDGCCRSDAECVDGNGCTEDTCNPDGDCEHAPRSGCCLTQADCDDGVSCTNDDCVLDGSIFAEGGFVGYCEHDAMSSFCVDDQNPCTIESCDPESCASTSVCDTSVGCVTHAPEPDCYPGTPQAVRPDTDDPPVIAFWWDGLDVNDPESLDAFLGRVESAGGFGFWQEGDLEGEPGEPGVEIGFFLRGEYGRSARYAGVQGVVTNVRQDSVCVRYGRRYGVWHQHLEDVPIDPDPANPTPGLLSVGTEVEPDTIVGYTGRWDGMLMFEISVKEYRPDDNLVVSIFPLPLLSESTQSLFNLIEGAQQTHQPGEWLQPYDDQRGTSFGTRGRCWIDDVGVPEFVGGGHLLGLNHIGFRDSVYRWIALREDETGWNLQWVIEDILIPSWDL